MSAHGIPTDGGPAGAGGEEKTASGDNAKVKLGRYEVVRELGKGAMGIVYLAKDPLIGRLVALKTIRPAAHADDDETKEFQQRFLREAQAAGILNHPAIVTVHDIGQDDTTGVSFIAMEYVEGQNLKEVLQQGRPITFEQIGDIVAQVAEGLDFAHAKGIVHRDVKPANIILLEGMRAKITDFGIAKIASGVSNLTTTGQFLGTPNYMAPEQIKGAPVDGRSDIFSLGICLYECLTRRKPFGGDSLTSISYKIVHEPFPPLAEINPQIPGGFEEVVAKALMKDPGKRYQRARDMAIALRAVNRGERPPAEPMQAEETMITRGHEKIPTVEIPFPDEVDATPAPLTTNPTPTAAPAAAVAARAKANASPRVQFKKTLTNVRAMPLWKRQLHPALFLGIVALCFLALGGAAIALKARAPSIPTVNVQAERQHARERELREQGSALLRQGRVNDAYAKFAELNRMAPNSPAVIAILQKLNSVRAQEEIGRQQQANAKTKFDEGMALYNQKKYAEAIPLFSEAFSLNPNSEDAAKYLKLAQQEQQNIENAKAEARQRRLTTTTGQQARTTTTTSAPQPQPGHTTATGGDGANHSATSASPVQFNVFFKSPFADGSVTVKVGADIIANEQLFTESRFLRRRSPKTVNVTTNITPKNSDIEVTVNVPSLQIQEHHIIQRVNLQPGSAHRLTITADAASKKFDYSLN